VTAILTISFDHGANISSAEEGFSRLQCTNEGLAQALHMRAYVTVLDASRLA
jgi:hypothetical protein